MNRYFILSIFCLVIISIGTDNLTATDEAAVDKDGADKTSETASIEQIRAKMDSVPKEESKDHYFFVGVDFKFPYEGEYYTMRGLVRNKALIRVDGQTVGTPIRNAQDFMFKKETKISKNYVEVENIYCEPEFSLGNNPYIQAAQTNMMMQDMASDTQDRINQMHNDLGVVQNRMANASSPEESAGYQTQIDAMKSMINKDTATLNIMPSNIQRGDISESGKDMLRVSFDIKADQRLENPYAVLVLKLKETENGPVTRTWIHWHSINTLTSVQETDHFVVYDFPDGHFIEEQDIHFFANGHELASNLSPKRIKMSRSEVKIFLNYQYIMQNKGETADPSPIWNTFDSGILLKLDESMLNEIITLSVDSEGNVTKIQSDNQKFLEPDASKVAEELKQMLIYPALQEGLPVAGKIRFKLQDFML